MKELVFALEFRGRGEAVPGGEGKRRARSTATSQILVTTLTASGVEARVESRGGETAVLEADVQRFADGTFVETGRIRYGAFGAVTFDTIGRGWVGPAPKTGAVAGGILWRITGGEGGLQGARGVIASNFTVDADGAVVDNHAARIYLP